MTRLDELNSAICTEKDLKVRTRLMIVRSVLELGHSAESIVEYSMSPPGASGSGRNGSTGAGLRACGTSQNPVGLGPSRR